MASAGWAPPEMLRRRSDFTEGFNNLSAQKNETWITRPENDCKEGRAKQAKVSNVWHLGIFALFRFPVNCNAKWYLCSPCNNS
ncbi:hypothetical protein M514_08275 [Trichuris suis]|uniref:Uncharacterized protein n=1 Tax=Trichuris suis TaxID=68888 RepID=A0A085NHH2_9BILA|nr:hypothetical protein M513_08275 [Trichuris suis]KFD68918.1 hypothetical protein M514_08275 [Trichuris suis]KHJ46583.1 hypothetical protein D918_02897 [Trichuris suis]